MPKILALWLSKAPKPLKRQGTALAFPADPGLREPHQGNEAWVLKDVSSPSARPMMTGLPADVATKRTCKWRMAVAQPTKWIQESWMVP